MVLVRKRRANRLSIKKNTRRTKDKQRRVPLLANPIIARNWDKSQTLAQNYKRLGLVLRLSAASGGDEVELEEQQAVVVDDQETRPERIPKGEARIVRDDEGNVVEVIYGTMERAAEQGATTELVRELEELSRTNYTPRERTQSDREAAWCRDCWDKYGDDYEKLFWDKLLNVMQLSVGQLRKKMTKWRLATVQTGAA